MERRHYCNHRNLLANVMALQVANSMFLPFIVANYHRYDAATVR